MNRHIAYIALLVRDYDEAIAWFAQALGFVLVEDSDLGGGKRWVRVAPDADAAFQLLLGARRHPSRGPRSDASTAAGSASSCTPTTSRATMRALAAAGARMDAAPRHEAYGTVIVFEDLYGNRWDLIGPPQ